jgi:hypothetical protein
LGRQQAGLQSKSAALFLTGCQNFGVVPASIFQIQTGSHNHAQHCAPELSVMMMRNLIYFVLVLSVSCASPTNVRVLDLADLSSSCKLVGTYETLQCVSGPASRHAIDNAVAELRKLTAKLDGDTIVCCKRADDNDEVVLAGYELKTGKIVCDGLGYMSGSIYQCKKSKEP